MRVELRWDDHEFTELLKSWQEPAVRKTLSAGASAFGKTAKPILKAETPVARPGNKYAKSSGNLQRLVRYKRIRRQYGIGVVVASMGKGAYYRRFVTGGTKAHIILPKSAGGRLAVLGGFATAVHHPGSKPNDYVARAAGRAERVGLDAAEEAIFKGLDAQRVTDTFDT